jgi:endonuclease-8
MPEGPSIVILKEAVQPFIGKKVILASGNSTKLDFDKITGKKILGFESWGKHFLICFPKFTIRIHFLLFGSYRINDRKDSPARLSLQTKSGELNFYSCSVKSIDEPLDELYDWTADVMSDQWDPKKALKKLKARPAMLVCDALLDQHIFSGVGNIIKNEVLFRIRVHPESLVGKLPSARMRLLLKESVRYSFQFLAWKKEFALKKHWLAHNKKECPRDGVPFKKQYLGKTNRRTFFCPLCQVKYA